MKYYDARIIEGCCVFSYDVKVPDHSSKKTEKRNPTSVCAWKKEMLRFLLFLLLPFAFVIDHVVMGVQKIYHKIRVFLGSYIRGYVFVTGVISAASITALIPILFNLL